MTMTPTMTALEATRTTTLLSSLFLTLLSVMTMLPNSAMGFSATPVNTNALVDMNQYNVDFDVSLQEWTANVKPATNMLDAGIYLGTKSKREYMVDIVTVSFARKPDCGMGILLEEIAGGREDGVGITVVTGLVEGGLAESSGILPGDCISSIAIKERTESTSDGDNDAKWNTVDDVPVECLGYDATVDAILGLPPVENVGKEFFVLTMKRIRRRPKVTLKIQYPPTQDEEDVTLELFSGENLRRSMLSRGVKLNDALAKRFDNGGEGNCGAEGTCATCVVSVARGAELLNPAGIQEQQMLSDNPRWRLGCKAIVGYGGREGEIVLRVNPKQWAE